jgi:hypothetical protein
MPNEQIQNLSDLRNDPRNLEIAKLLDMKIPVIFSPLTDPYDERSVLNRLNELGHCVKLVYTPTRKQERQLALLVLKTALVFQTTTVKLLLMRRSLH